MTARALMQLVDPPGRITGGNILLGRHRYRNRLPPRGAAIRAIRGRRIGLIFQEPMSSLSPVHTIGAQIVEVLRLHLRMGREEARARTIELLRQVEIADPERNIDRYTFEFSGGAACVQRAMIAMALSPAIPKGADRRRADDGARRHATQAEVLDLIGATCSASSADGDAADHP